jgi:uncharacterized protein
MERIGTLARVRRYPVKSMAGEELDAARVTYAGIVGDRVYAFIDQGNQSDFPWMTARQGHEMILFRPRFLNAPTCEDDIPSREQYAIEVTTPEAKKFEMGDAALTSYLESRFGRRLRLRFSERSMTDARPVSIMGLASLRALSQEAGLQLDPIRFRANFYVNWENDKPYFEDELVGRELQIGEQVMLQIVKKDGRCIITTLDPQTAASSPVVLEKVAREHQGFIGVYAAVLREGIVRADDPIYLM